MGKRIIELMILALSLCAWEAKGQEQDSLLSLLKQELEYNMRELGKQEIPPYFMSFRVIDEHKITIGSLFGALSVCDKQHDRMFVPQIRLGSMELDNFKQSLMGGHSANGYAGSLLPLENGNEEAIKERIWSETLMRYRLAKQNYKQVLSLQDMAKKDTTACFSSAPVETYYEAPFSEQSLEVNVETWKNRLNEISAVFKSMPELTDATASLEFQASRTYIVNTEGLEVVMNRIAARVFIGAAIKADDGMVLPLYKDYFVYDLKDIPNNEIIIADARQLMVKLQELKNAPVADPYTGPALLSGTAGGVFFHEIFGHRLETSRMISGGETFRNMVGEKVLPEDFQVYSDPTLERYAGMDMNGHYPYDDEGVKAVRVKNVENGILKNFLLTRKPMDNFWASNAHARTGGGGDPVARQSNLIVETLKPYSEEKLRDMLIEEARKQGKEYGYYFKEVTGGYTLTGEGNTLNSFNVNPIEVYRVFVDGRPDQMVRGVDLIGTPLSIFSNIVAGGDKVSVFSGSCGAESGWVPVTACSPMLFVSQVETQRRGQQRDIPSLLPPPGSGN